MMILHDLGSILQNLALAAVVIPVSVADKAKSDDFDPWRIDLMSGLLKKKIKIHLKIIRSELLIAVSLPSLRTLVCKFANKGEGAEFPPPPEGGVLRNTAARYGLRAINVQGAS